jgi:hypothetical protein
MSEIIDLSQRRNAKEQPDADCIRKDEYGRPLYLFALEYQMPDGAYGTEVWAYSFEDAEARVTAMRSSLSVLGQMYGFVPA